MKKLLAFSSLSLLALFLGIGQVNAQMLTAVAGKITLTGVAPLETITANSDQMELKLDPKSKAFNVRVNMKSFSFSKGQLQKDHAEEKFFEVSKFAYATFKGTIVSDADITKPGSHEVIAKGKFNLHGVEKEIKMPATITVADGKTTLNAKFSVFLSDYGITIPKLNVRKVAEEFGVDVNATLK